MADVMGVPIGTVRSRIFRGRRALQAHLGGFHAGNSGVKGRPG
jgi:DNA-directed RNA polymerase specialized sigma24 family protein